MHFLKKVLTLVLIFSFFTHTTLSAAPFFTHVKNHFKEDLLDGSYPGTRVRVSSGRPNEYFYIRQERARKFLGVNSYGIPVSSPEEIEIMQSIDARPNIVEIEAPPESVVKNIYATRLLSNVVEIEAPPESVVKNTYATRLLSRLEAQQGIQEGVVRKFMEPFLKPLSEFENLDFSGLIFCSPFVKDDASFVGNHFPPDWIDENRHLLRINEYYRVQCLKFNPRSIMIGGEETNISYPDALEENPHPWLRIFFGPHKEERTPELSRVTTLAFLGPVLNPELSLAPDFEPRRKGVSGIFDELKDRGNDYFPFLMDSRAIDSLLEKQPYNLILRLFTDPLNFQAKMRFSVLRNAIRSLERAQTVLRKVKEPPSQNGEATEASAKGNSSKSQSPRRPSSRRKSRLVADFSVQSFFDEMGKVEASEKNNEELLSSWEPAVTVYGKLLRNLFDVKSKTSQTLNVLKNHVKKYWELFESKNVPFDSETSSKAPREMQFGPEMNDWCYDLLKNSELPLEQSLRWALYFGFDINHRPSHEHPSLLMHYTQKSDLRALELLIKHGASFIQEGESSPVDDAVKRKDIKTFCRLLQSLPLSVPPQTILLRPQDALTWYHHLRHDGQLNGPLEDAFDTLAEQHFAFAWNRLLDQYLIREEFSEDWIDAEENALQGMAKKLASILKEMRQLPDGDRASYLERYTFEYLVKCLNLDEDPTLKERAQRKIIQRFKTRLSPISLDDLKEACPGVSSQEEFLFIEQVRYFLEEKLRRPILLETGLSLSNIHKALKQRIISYLMWLDDQLRLEPKKRSEGRLIKCKGYFQDYNLPRQFQVWLSEENSIPPEGLTFERIRGETLFIAPCDSWITSQMAAHIFASTLFDKIPYFECVRVEGGGTQHQVFSIFSEGETLATSDFELKQGNILGLTEDKVPFSSKSLSQYLISLLLLTPKLHLKEDVRVFRQGEEICFALSGHAKDFFQSQPSSYWSDCHVPGFLAKVPVDPGVREFFQNLDIDDLIVKWLLELTRIQSRLPKDHENQSECELPLSLEEFGALYLRILFLQHLFKEIKSPLTHLDLVQYIDPWKTRGLKVSKKVAQEASQPSGNLKLPPLFSYPEYVQRSTIAGNLKSWVQGGEMGALFGNWAAFFQAVRSETISLTDVKAARIPPTCLIVPCAQKVTRNDLDGLVLDGVTFLSMRDQPFSTEGTPSMPTSRIISDFFSLVSQSQALLYLDISGLGGRYLLNQSLNLRFQALKTLLFEGIPVGDLTIDAPFLETLSLRSCSSLKGLKLKTPSLKSLDLTDASFLGDKNFVAIVTDLPKLEKVNLTGTRVAFSDFRALSFEVSQEDFELMSKRLRGSVEDFLNGRGRLRRDRLCSGSDAIDQARRVLGKTLLGPLRDFKKVKIWAQERVQAWQFPQTQNLETLNSHSHDMTKVLKAPVATPMAAAAGGLGYFGLPLVASHPIGWAAAPALWWLGGSVKSVQREIEEGLRASQILLGEILARAVKQDQRTSVNLKGIGLDVDGLVSFVSAGGLEGIQKLNLAENALGDLGGEFLREFLAEGNYASLTISLSGNGINPGTLAEIKRLTSSNSEEEVHNDNNSSPLTAMTDEEQSGSLLSLLARGSASGCESVTNNTDSMGEAFTNDDTSQIAVATLALPPQGAQKGGGVKENPESHQSKVKHFDRDAILEEDQEEEEDGEFKRADQSSLRTVNLLDDGRQQQPSSSLKNTVVTHREEDPLLRTSIRPEPLAQSVEDFLNDAQRKFFGLHISDAMGPQHVNTLLNVLEILEGFIGKPLGEFYNVMGGGHGGALVEMLLSIPQASGKLSFSKPRPPLISDIKPIVAEACAQLAHPNYNLRGQEPLFSWAQTGTLWGDYFKQQTIGHALKPLVLTIGKSGIPSTITGEGEESEILASYLATALTPLPWPYHVGASLNEEGGYEPSNLVIKTRPSLVAKRIKQLFPGAQRQNIYIFSLNGLSGQQDFNNVDRNGGQVITYPEEDILEGEFNLLDIHITDLPWTVKSEVSMTAETRRSLEEKVRGILSSNNLGDYLRAL